MAAWFPDGIHTDSSTYRIVPGGYAVVGEYSRCLSHLENPYGWAIGPEALAPPAGRDQASLRRTGPFPRIAALRVLPRVEGLRGGGHLGPGHPEETEGGCPQGRLRWQEQ